MVKIIKIAKDTPADPHMLRDIDVTGRQVQPHRRTRQQRDAERRGRALVEGHGVENPMVALCRSGTRQAAADKAACMRGGDHTEPKTVRQRWGAFLLQTGRPRLTVAQARSLRRRSTTLDLSALTLGELRRLFP